jgi:two-component system sensor histidine kinase KdpD
VVAISGEKDVADGPARSRRGGPLAAGGVVLALSAAGLAGALALERVGQGSLAPLTFLLAVLVAAAGFGTTAGIATAVLSFVGLNFFFIPPTWTLRVAGWPEIFALGVYLLVAVTTGGLAGRLREEADAARQHARMLERLHAYSGRLAAAETTEQILDILGSQLESMTGATAVMLSVEGESVRQVWPARPVALSPADQQAALYAARRGRIGAVAEDEAQGFEFRPWSAGPATPLVIGVAGGPPAPGRDEAIEALLQQAAVAAERTRLAEATQEARAETERERLRAALLSSLSHDLRTPLASILGAVTSLRQLGGALRPEDRDDLLAAIEEEAERLSRFVANLLDMTRLQAGALAASRDWIDAADAARAAVDRARQAFPKTAFDLSVPPGAPPVRGDAVLLEQALFNLLDNAARFGGEAARVSVSLEPTGDSLRIAVTDAGPGIPAEDLPRVFDSFYRGAQSPGTPGSGLGLAISRGMLQAMGGTIEAVSPVVGGRGTRMLVQLPREADDAGGGRS